VWLSLSKKTKLLNFLWKRFNPFNQRVDQKLPYLFRDRPTSVLKRSIQMSFDSSVQAVHANDTDTVQNFFFNQIHMVELSSSRYEDWIGCSFKRSWKCPFRLYMSSLEERVGFMKLENFTALFHLCCPTQVTRTVGIKSGYTHVDCNALKYCTTQYLVFVEVKFRTELSCVITHAMWQMKVACLSDTSVATYSLLILILICTAF